MKDQRKFDLHSENLREHAQAVIGPYLQVKSGRLFITELT